MARQDVLNIRVSQDETARWRHAAATAGLSLSAWMRQVADMAATTGIDAAQLRADLVRLRGDLNRGPGNALNQIAAMLNAAGPQRSLTGSQTAALAAAAEDIAGIRVALEQALKGMNGARRHPKRRTLQMPQMDDQAHSPAPGAADVLVDLNERPVNHPIIPAELEDLLNMVTAA